MKIIKHEVHDLLWKYPKFREDDNKIIATIWLREAMSEGLTEPEARKFLRLLVAKKLTNPESIRRSRQQSQEKFPLLRGKNYKNMQKEQERVHFDLGYTS